jgi:hypothetical protein
VDARLVTIAPSFQGIIQGLRGYIHDGPSAERRQQLLSIARRAVGTTDAKSFHAEDTKRVLVVCDWMARCALPLWLDRLASWCSESAVARQLREATPLLWTVQIVEACHLVAPAWARLWRAVRVRDERTSDEIHAATAARCSAVFENVNLVMNVLPAAILHALPERRYGREDRDDEAWLTGSAIRLALGAHMSEVPDPIVMATVPQLVDVLLQVQPGDGPDSVAARCQWAAPGMPRNKSTAA